MPDYAHRSYGIQNWLCGKGYCMDEGAKYKVNPQQYFDLLKEFCLKCRPDFKFGKGKELRSYEAFVDMHFFSFCSYVNKKFKQP